MCISAARGMAEADVATCLARAHVPPALGRNYRATGAGGLQELDARGPDDPLLAALETHEELALAVVVRRLD